MVQWRKDSLEGRCRKFVDNGRLWQGKKFGDICKADLPCNAEHISRDDGPHRTMTEEEWLDQAAAELLEEYGPDFKGHERIDDGCNCYFRNGHPEVKIETYRCSCWLWLKAYERAGIPKWKD